MFFMIMKQNPLTFEQLIAELRQLCHRHLTGTMFITTDDNHSVRFVLENGEIVSWAYGHRRGTEALNKILTVKSGRYSFAEGIFNSVDELPLPNTDELLQVLESGIDGTINSEILLSEPPVDDQFAQTETEELRLHGEALVRAFGNELSLYLGPLGSHACQHYAEQIRQIQSQKDLFNLIDQVVTELDDSRDIEQFRQRIRQIALV